MSKVIKYKYNDREQYLVELDDGTTVFVPKDKLNKHYVEIQKLEKKNKDKK